MANRLLVVSLFLVVVLIGVGRAQTSGNNYCERLDEMKLMPFRSSDVIEDEVYNGLRSQGKTVAACLLGKVTDTRPMADPRQAPRYPGFTVGDAAVMVLSDICNMSIEDALPAQSRLKWKEQGIYAYFEFVAAGVEHRQQIADALEKQGCN